MKRLLIFLLVLSFGMIIGHENVFALNFGTEITIWDGNSTYQRWHKPNEDQEVEPGMAHGQKWDLEGVFFDENSWMLTIVGGYDFVNGAWGSGHWMAGDIFIDVTGNAWYGDYHSPYSKNERVESTFGYDFVFDMDFDTGFYDVYDLREGGSTYSAYFRQNNGSNPWRYADGGSIMNEDQQMTLWGYGSDGPLSRSDTGFRGKNHYGVTVDMSMLSPYIDGDLGFIAHNTMQCGNDNIIGKGHTATSPAPVPEPSTIALLGMGLLVGSITARRKKTTEV